MAGIDPDFWCHKLAILMEASPIAQKKSKLGEERRIVVQKEIEKLKRTGFIRGIKYTTWLANVVLVKKKNEE